MFTRRGLLHSAAAVPVSASAASRSDATNLVGAGGPIAVLPDRAAFSHKGVHLNAAYTHVLPNVAADAGWRHLNTRRTDGWREFPVDNDRDAAAAAFAALIGADPHEIAVVPSTNEGENLIAAAAA